MSAATPYPALAAPPELAAATGRAPLPEAHLLPRALLLAAVMGALVAPVSSSLLALFGVHPFWEVAAHPLFLAQGFMLGAVAGPVWLVHRALLQRGWAWGGWVLTWATALLLTWAAHLDYLWLAYRYEIGWIESLDKVLQEEVLAPWSTADLATLVLSFASVAFGLALGSSVGRRGIGARRRLLVGGGATALLSLLSVSLSDLLVISNPMAPGSWWTPWWESARCHWTLEIATTAVAIGLLLPWVLAGLERRWPLVPTPPSP